MGRGCQGRLSGDDPVPDHQVEDCALRRRSGQNSAGWGCVLGGSTTSLEAQGAMTHVWVREVYLEYQQVPDSDPAHYEFLWGPEPMWRPASLRYWSIWTEWVEGVPAPSIPSTGRGGGRGTLSQSSSQEAPSRPCPAACPGVQERRLIFPS